MSTADSLPARDVPRPLTWRQQLAAVAMFMRRDFLLMTHFKTSFVTGLMAAVTPLIIYGMIARFGDGVPGLGSLTGGYVSFVISGMMVAVILGAPMTGPYAGLMNSFWNDRIEVIMVSPLSLSMFITGLSAGRGAQVVISAVLYGVGGWLLGVDWPGPLRLLGAFALLIPAIFACLGLGLAAASSVYTLDARGGQDPIRFVVSNIAGLVAGVYFPLHILPAWAQWIGHLIPHTYAVDGARRILFPEGELPPLLLHQYLPLPPLWADLAVLCVYAAVALPVGWRLFRFGIELARGDGRLSRWQ